MEKLEKEAYLYQEFLKRLSTQEFWEEFKKFYNIKNLDEFGIDIYEKLEAYHTVLNAKVDSAMQDALNAHSDKELNIIRAELETINLTTDRLRFLLSSEKKKINETLKGIDSMGKKSFKIKPKHIIYRPKSEKVIDDIVCPYCDEINKRFQYDMPCQFCHELIGNPWKENTVCPNNECSRVINRSDIYSDRSAYDFDSLTQQITCPNCETRFDWTKYRRQPEIRGIKVCINCDITFIPDKYNWRTQRICPDCKRKGIDSFNLDNPEYQKKYRKKNKK